MSKEWTKVHSLFYERQKWMKYKEEGSEYMAKRAEIEARTEKLVLPIMEENQFELVDVEYVKEGANWYLRVYVDKEGGIAIDDCVLVSRELEKHLDEEDFIKDPYILEVSSPGLLRPLKKDKDFERNLGKMIEIKLFQGINKQKEFEGILKSYDSEQIVLELEEEELEIKRSNLALCRLAFEF